MDHPSPRTLGVEMFANTPSRRLVLLQAVWPAAVGPKLARRSVVVAFDAGVLRIRVPDASWRKVLFRMRGEILARLRRAAGPAAPRTLGFVEGPVPEPPASDEPRTPPLTEAPSNVAAAAATIDDDTVRERFLETAARYLGRFGETT